MPKTTQNSLDLENFSKPDLMCRIGGMLIALNEIEKLLTDVRSCNFEPNQTAFILGQIHATIIKAKQKTKS